MSLDNLKSFMIAESTYGGVNKQISDHLLDASTARVTDNYTLRSDGLEVVNGWAKLTDQVLSDGEASPEASEVIALDQYFKNDGSSFFLAFTNKRAYKFQTSNDLWVPISPGTPSETVIDATSTSGTKILNVADETGYSPGDTIIIAEGEAEEEENVVDSVAAGVLTLLNNLTFTHTVPGEEDAVRRTYGAAIVDSDSAAAGTTLNVSHTDQFTAGEEIVVNLGGAREEYLVITGITAGVSLTVQRPTWAGGAGGLEFTHTAVQADKVYRLAEFTYGAGSDPTQIDSVNTNNMFYFSDGIRRVQQWDGAGYHEALPGTDDAEDLSPGQTAIPKYIRAFENFLIMANMTEVGIAIPQKIRWPQFGDFETWKNNADGSGQAGYATFEGADWIQAVHQLKRELLFYRERSVEAMTFVGEPDIFVFRRAETGIGLWAEKALVDLGDEHVFVAPDNIYRYNGISAVQIGDQIKDDFFNSLLPSRRSQVKLFLLEETDEILLSYATADTAYNNKAYIYNLLAQKWAGPKDLDERSFGYYERTSDITIDEASGTMDGAVGTFDGRSFSANAPLNMMGSADGLVFILDEATTMDGATVNSRYESRLSDLGAGEISKRVQMVRLEMRKGNVAETVSVYVGTARFVGDPVAWEGPLSLSIEPDSEPFVFCDVTGKFVKIRVDAAVPVAIREIEVFFLPGGYT